MAISVKTAASNLQSAIKSRNPVNILRANTALMQAQAQATVSLARSSGGNNSRAAPAPPSEQSGVFSQPFFTAAGQRERLVNVGRTLSTVLNPFNRDQIVVVPLDSPAPVINNPLVRTGLLGGAVVGAIGLATAGASALGLGAGAATVSTAASTTTAAGGIGLGTVGRIAAAGAIGLGLGSLLGGSRGGSATGEQTVNPSQITNPSLISQPQLNPTTVTETVPSITGDVSQGGAGNILSYAPSNITNSYTYTTSYQYAPAEQNTSPTQSTNPTQDVEGGEAAGGFGLGTLILLGLAAAAVAGGD